MNELFGGWDPILRVLTVGPLAYAAMVILLRVSGKRTLSKMNSFDFVVTISLGSVLAATITNANLALATAVTAMAVLIIAQFLITALSVRFNWFENVVKGDPTLVAADGRLLRDAMRRTRVTRAEVEAAVRAAGTGELDDVLAIVLETDGTFTVIGRSAGAVSGFENASPSK